MKMIKDTIEMQQKVDACVFHYTNAGTLIGMLNKTSKEYPFMTFWASHISYMNDPKEKEYGLEKMWEVLCDIENDLSIPKTQRISELNRNELDQFILAQSVEKNSLTNIYSISFSKSFDSLPMWNMYGQNGNGICLGFDINMLNDFLKSKEIESLNKILYGVGENINNHQEMIDDMSRWKTYVKMVYEKNMFFLEENAFKKDINKDTDKKSHDLNIALFNYMALLAFVPLGIKHPSYKYENEYRLYCRELTHKVHFRDRSGLLLPYVEFAIPLDALKIVVVGPTADKNRQVMSVAKLLNEKGKDYKTLTFYSSEIPYLNH